MVEYTAVTAVFVVNTLLSSLTGSNAYFAVGTNSAWYYLKWVAAERGEWRGEGCCFRMPEDGGGNRDSVRVNVLCLVASCFFSC